MIGGMTFILKAEEIASLPPKEGEIEGWLLETLRHTCQMEYYLGILGLGSDDPERPHDIYGKHNKLEWEIIKGCALAYRKGLPKDLYDRIIIPRVQEAVLIHRLQYHHQMYNDYNEDATADDLRVGALDTVCALLEKRPYYQKCADSPEEIIANVNSLITSANRLVKIQWVSTMAKEIKRIARPDIYSIESLSGFPNLGLEAAVYDNIDGLMQNCLKMLREENGYVIG